MALLSLPALGPAADSYRDVVRAHISLEAPESNGMAPDEDSDAATLKYSELAQTLRDEAQAIAEAPEVLPVPAERPAATMARALTVLFSLVGGLVLGVVAFNRFASRNRQYNPWAIQSTTGLDLSGRIRAEEESFSEFVAAFQTGPSAVASGTPTMTDDRVTGTSPESDVVVRQASRLAVAEFYPRATNILVTFRKLLQDIGRARDESARHELLAELGHAMRGLKGESALPEVLPVWQMASALEGLLKQLTDNLSNVTPSTLRTVTGAVDLLGEMCLPGLAADLLTAQPLRLLAVDDDPISRKAVSLALKRALNVPDLAEDGATALVLASKQAYDVIFLDVQMPGMDGFELCTRIHETVPNRWTPVVFVTCQSDFNARAQSTLSGGSDLIGKPFLTFEITVKALTLALRGRLRGRENNHRSRKTVDLPATAEGTVSGAQALALNSAPEVEAGADKVASTDCASSSQTFAHEQGGCPSAPEVIAAEFLRRALEHLDPLRFQFQAMYQTADEAARQDMLADVYLRIHSFTPRADLPAMHPAIQMSAALEGLLRKLLEDPRNSTVSTLITVAAGVEMLNDLCQLGLNSDLVTHPPIRMLVVDDDPVARRAVVGTLQMAFEKPESAEGGADALALTSAKSYDVIFLDVQMPGMDGFEVCSRIRESGGNRNTPVVFVTGQNDFNARTQMSLSGGSDFVGKPFLTSEITVKALTFALRGRLEKLFVAPASADAP